jgi:CHAT domain-containing protein
MTFDEISAYVRSVSEAFQELVNAPIQEKPAILQRKKHLLLTDIADRIAIALIENHRKSDDPDERRLTDYLEAHRHLLRRCRESGTAVIWVELEAIREAHERLSNDGTSKAILYALMAFYKAPFSQKRWILEQEQHYLLTDTADRLLTNMIEEAEQSNDAEPLKAVAQLNTVRDLLRQARKIGIAAAWEELEAWKNVLAQIEPEASYFEVREAILQLALASPQQAREILESKQHLLLVNGSVQLIDLLAQEAQQKDQPELANRLLNTGKLIRQIQESGIAIVLEALAALDNPALTGITPADLAAVSAALRDFIFADGREEMRQVVERHQDVLLNDIAEYLLKLHIKGVKQQNKDETGENLQQRLEHSLLFLRVIRQSGLGAVMALIDAAAHSDEISSEETFSENRSTMTTAKDTLSIIQQWASIRNYREQRRFLETHPELLDGGLEAHLQIMFERERVQEEALHEEQKWISSMDAEILQLIRERIVLLRDIRSRGGTIQAIRDGYVNAFTGFALDLPDWLEQVEDQYQLLIIRDEPADVSSPTAQMIVDLLRPALGRARHDVSLASEILAELYMRLGRFLSGLDSIRANEAVEEAIPYLEAALTVYTSERYLNHWADIQFCLAGVYFDRISNDRQDNLELARLACENALLFFTSETHPSTWAKLQENLGLIYQERASGNAHENLDSSINHSNAALTVFVRATYPLEWAHIQVVLGNTYHKRSDKQLWSVKKGNQQLAIAYIKAALEVFTREEFPIQWAGALHNLNTLLHETVQNNQFVDNHLQQIIFSDKEILEVFTQDLFPRRWAMVHNSLGTLYADLATDDASDNNLKQAIQHLEATLQIYTRETFPLDFQHTHLNIAQLAHWKMANSALEKGDKQAAYNAYALAHHHYALARDVQAELGWLTANSQTRAILQGSVNEMYLRDAWCLLQIGDLCGAIVALEVGRAQALAEYQAIADAQLEKVCTLHREHFIAARQSLQSTLTGEDRLAIRTARDTFLKARQDIRECCHKTFLPDEPTYQEIANAAAPDQALIYLAAMDRGGVALVVPPAQPQTDEDKREPFAISLPHLTYKTSIEWLEKVNNKKGKLGGFRFDLEFNGVKLISHWLYQAESEEERAKWLSVPFQDLPHTLPSSMPTLRRAVERMLRSWQAEADRLSSDVRQQQKVQDIRRQLITPLRQAALLATNLTSDLGWFVLEVELEQVLQDISETFARELREKLDQHGLHSTEQRIALIPCGRLGTLPIHAATVRNDPATGEEIPFLDTCELSYQASARSLATARSRLDDLPANGPVLAVGDPKTTGAARLPYAGIEARKIAALARRRGHKESLSFIGEEATIENVEDTLLLFRQHYPGAWLHIASHGHADSTDPTNCYMLLSNKQKLTLTDLQHKHLLEGWRGFNASGCVTGLGDIITAPDELSSFAAGILQAGAPCTLATLWSVNDHANYLLMLRYMQEMLQLPSPSPAHALREAVRWLRHATHRDIQRLGEPGLRDVHSTYPQENMPRAVLRGITIQDSDDSSPKEASASQEPVQPYQNATQVTFPYSHPVYWASAILYGA